MKMKKTKKAKVHYCLRPYYTGIDCSDRNTFDDVCMAGKKHNGCWLSTKGRCLYQSETPIEKNPKVEKEKYI